MTTTDAFQAVVLQATQEDLFNHVLNDALIGSSIYVNIALAGVSLVAFALMAWNVEDPRANLIVVSAMAVCAVSITSYTGLASGLTLSVIEMPEGHALAGGSVDLAGGPTVDGTISLWGRYLTWAFSTPFILLALGLIAGSSFTKIFTAIVFDVGIMIGGLAAALTTSNLLLRWWFYILACVFFLVVVYILLAEWPNDAEITGTTEIFDTLRLLTVVLWFGYTIWWAVGNEGLALVESSGITSWGYSAMDVVAKYLFGFLVVRYAVNNIDKVSEGADYGSTTSTPTAADD